MPGVPSEAPPVPTTRAATVVYGLVAAAAWIWAAIFGHVGILFGERAPRGIHFLAAVGCGLAIVAACHVAYRLWRCVRRASDFMRALLGPMTAAQALYLAGLSGIAEEMAFRGALWPHAGIFWTSLIFGIAHVLPLRALMAYPLFAFAVGLLLGWLRDWSGSIWPPAVAHMTVNALNLAWIGRRPPPAAEEPA